MTPLRFSEPAPLYSCLLFTYNSPTILLFTPYLSTAMWTTLDIQGVKTILPSTITPLHSPEPLQSLTVFVHPHPYYHTIILYSYLSTLMELYAIKGFPSNTQLQIQTQDPTFVPTGHRGLSTQRAAYAWRESKNLVAAIWTQS